MPYWILGCCALVVPAWGDVFWLNDGSKVEGVLVSQNASSYVVEVQVTKSIKDERVIPKADVRNIETAKVDDEAFKRISTLGPQPDGLRIHEYDQRIQQIENFIQAYPTSPRIKEATAMLDALKEERQAIKDGGLKSNGVLHTPQDYRANAYDMDANLAAVSIQRLVTGGHYLQALRAFVDFERDYGSTEACRRLKPRIAEAIRRYLAEVNQSVETYDQRIKEREDGLQRMSDRDRGSSVLAIRQQQEELENQFNQQKESKIGWVTPDPFFKPALDHAISHGKSELKRLEGFKSSNVQDGGKVYRDVMALAKRGVDPQAAKNAISMARQAGIPQRYLDQLQAELDASDPPEK